MFMQLSFTRAFKNGCDKTCDNEGHFEGARYSRRHFHTVASPIKHANYKAKVKNDIKFYEANYLIKDIPITRNEVIQVLIHT